jgi:hypothetical protein
MDKVIILALFTVKDQPYNQHEGTSCDKTQRDERWKAILRNSQSGGKDVIYRPMRLTLAATFVLPRRRPCLW